MSVVPHPLILPLQYKFRQFQATDKWNTMKYPLTCKVLGTRDLSDVLANNLRIVRAT
jgi:hypothetical protein